MNNGEAIKKYDYQEKQLHGKILIIKQAFITYVNVDVDYNFESFYRGIIEKGLTAMALRMCFHFLLLPK